jgi:hypothetical protein
MGIRREIAKESLLRSRDGVRIVAALKIVNAKAIVASKTIVPSIRIPPRGIKCDNS